MLHIYILPLNPFREVGCHKQIFDILLTGRFHCIINVLWYSVPLFWKELKYFHLFEVQYFNKYIFTCFGMRLRFEDFYIITHVNWLFQELHTQLTKYLGSRLLFKDNKGYWLEKKFQFLKKSIDPTILVKCQNCDFRCD